MVSKKQGIILLMAILIGIYAIIEILPSILSSPQTETRNYGELNQLLDERQKINYSATYIVTEHGSSGGSSGYHREEIIIVEDGKLISGPSEGLTDAIIRSDIKAEIANLSQSQKSNISKFVLSNGDVCFDVSNKLLCFDKESNLVHYNYWNGAGKSWTITSLFNISDNELWLFGIDGRTIIQSKEKTTWCENENCRLFFNFLSNPSERNYQVSISENYTIIQSVNGLKAFPDGIYKITNSKLETVQAQENISYLDEYTKTYITEIGWRETLARLQTHSCRFNKFADGNKICFEVNLSEECLNMEPRIINKCIYCFNSKGNLYSINCSGVGSIVWNKL